MAKDALGDRTVKLMTGIPSPNELDFDGVSAFGLDFGPDQDTTASSPIDDLNRYSNSAESMEEDREQPKQKRKRVRTTTVSQACGTCRKRVCEDNFNCFISF
jgi:hypothetical protein